MLRTFRVVLPIPESHQFLFFGSSSDCPLRLPVCVGCQPASTPPDVPAMQASGQDRIAGLWPGALQSSEEARRNAINEILDDKYLSSRRSVADDRLCRGAPVPALPRSVADDRLCRGAPVPALPRSVADDRLCRGARGQLCRGVQERKRRGQYGLLSWARELLAMSGG